VPGYDDGPAGGPGGRGFHGPRVVLSWSLGRVRGGQGACGSASTRFQAAVIAAAQGQVAWIFRRRQPGVLAGADRVLHPGLDSVRGVDIGVLSQPALRGGGPVRHPQAVPPPCSSRILGRRV
jgi:hypothetical protein